MPEQNKITSNALTIKGCILGILFYVFTTKLLSTIAGPILMIVVNKLLGTSPDKTLFLGILSSTCIYFCSGTLAGFIAAIYSPGKEVKAAAQLGLVFAGLEIIRTFKMLDSAEVNFLTLALLVCFIFGMTVFGGYWRKRFASRKSNL